MAIAFRSEAHTSYASRESITIDKPTGVVAGDFLIASIMRTRGSNDNLDGTVTTPSGWLQIGTATAPAAGAYYARFEVWWKRAGASEPTTYTWSTAITFVSQGCIAAYSNDYPIDNPIDAFSQYGTNFAFAGILTIPGVTTLGPNRKLLWVGQNWNGTGTLNPPSGDGSSTFMTERFDGICYNADEDIPLAGATYSTYTQLQATSDPASAFLIAVRESEPPPAYRSHTLTAYTSYNDIVVSKPTGVAQDDVLLAGVFYGRFDTYPDDLLPPSGWTQIGSTSSRAYGGINAKFSVWYKRAGAGEPSSYTWSFYQSVSAQAVLVAYSGCAPIGSPIDTFSFNAWVSAVAFPWPAIGLSVTASTPFEKLVWLGHNWEGSGALTPPTGMTERADEVIYLSDETLTASGATGNRTQNQSHSGPWHIYMLALRNPTAGGVIVPVTGLSLAVTNAGVSYGAATYTAPAFRAKDNTGYNSGQTSCTVNKPAGTAENDILLASLFRGRSAGGFTSVTVPSGWTLIGSQEVASGGFNGLYAVWWKRAGSSEPSSYTWDHAGNSCSDQGYIAAYSGCPTSDSPIDVSSVNYANNGNPITGTGVTTTQPNDMLVWLGHNWDASGALTPPTGMTERYDHLTYSADQVIASPGATGNRTQTQASSNPWQVRLLALLGVASSTPVTVNIGAQTATVSVGDVSVTAAQGVTITLGGQSIGVSSGTASAQPIYNGLTAGSVVGLLDSGGSLPTGWEWFASIGDPSVEVTRSTFVSDEVECFEMKIVGVGNTRVDLFLPNGFGGTVPAALGDMWRCGSYILRVAQTGGGLTGTTTQLYEVDASSTFLGRHFESAAAGVSVGLASTYREIDGTYINAATAKTNATIRFTLGTGGTATIRLASKLTKLGNNMTVLVSGNPIAASVGTVTVIAVQHVSTTVGGQQVGVSVGTVTVVTVTSGSSVTVSVTGQSVTAYVGTVTIGVGQTVSVTGQSLTASVGTVINNFAYQVLVTGQQLQASVGSVVVSLPKVVTLTNTNLMMTVSLGNESVAIGKAVLVNGQSITASVGTVTINYAYAVLVGGQQCTVSAGLVDIASSSRFDVTGTQIAVAMSGVEVSGAANADASGFGLLASSAIIQNFKLDYSVFIVGFEMDLSLGRAVCLNWGTTPEGDRESWEDAGTGVQDSWEPEERDTVSDDGWTRVRSYA